MSETFKYPNGGNDVTIVRKDDIIKCIDEQIIDKEVALAIVTQCEKDAIEFLKAGRWTGLPNIGSVKTNKDWHELNDADLNDGAASMLSHEDYVLFRKNQGINNYRKLKIERFYRYVVSMTANKNKKLYRKLCNEQGEVYARLHMYYTYNVKYITSEPEFKIEDFIEDEQ
jgi:hypothetical protein